MRMVLRLGIWITCACLSWLGRVRESILGRFARIRVSYRLYMWKVKLSKKSRLQEKFNRERK